jgi:hypothetical protein
MPENPLYPRIIPTRRSGQEAFHRSETPHGFTLLDFWQWYASDLPGNVLRGCIAEYLVAKALNCTDGVRDEWDACDVRVPGGPQVEVKSAAYHQSWPQKALSKISFSIKESFGWDAATDTTATVKSRPADVYVFCVLADKDRATLDVLDLTQWEFYVLSRHRLPAQKSIGLEKLLSLKPRKATFAELRDAVRQAAQVQNNDY